MVSEYRGRDRKRVEIICELPFILVSILDRSVLHFNDGCFEEHGASYMWPFCLCIFLGNGILRASIKYAEKAII